MKLLIGIILNMSLAIIGLCLITSNFKKHELKRLIQIILSIALLIIANYEIILFSPNERWNLFAHSVYFVATDWLLYYMLQFSIEFSGSDFDRYVKRKLMILLLAADGISLLLNSIFYHMFTLYPVTQYNGEQFYAMKTTPFFYIHYFIIIMLVTLCLITLFHRSFRAPLFYRRKYLVITIIMVMIITANILSFRHAIDFSIIGYAIEAFAVYHCVFIFTPQRLLHKTMNSVSKDMPVGIIVMDIEGTISFKSYYAEQLLSIVSPTFDEKGTRFKDWCREQYLAKNDSISNDYTFYRDSNEIILNIHLRFLTDENDKFQGGYFIVYDRTKEINKMREDVFLATHDSLTGLYNKSYFCQKAREYIDTHPDEEMLIVCSNIKNFKMINDFFGSAAGDLILKNCADVVKNEENKAIVYGRLNNDIFAILVRKSDFKEEQFTRQMQKVSSPIIKDGIQYHLINYIGVYEITDRSIPVTVMCDRARLAISQLKGDFHKKVTHYNEAFSDNIRYESELAGELSDAIEHKQLKMYLQPQVSSDGKMLGAEALVRWEHPVKGIIFPGQFIPIFEKNGLISDVDKYIWETACIKLREWKNIGREDLHISVNISPKDFYFLNIYQILTELVEKYDINPQNLKLEITETAVSMDFKRQTELISKLRKYGFDVEMDDFGSGNSSLNMLKDIYVDVLKIDMAFLHKAQDEERSRKILQMIISLSKQLDMTVITEGVETFEQVKFLDEMGCDIFQGYYFDKPMPVEMFEEKYIAD